LKDAHTGEAFKSFIGRLNQTSLSRVHYCYQIGSTFIYLNRMEDSIISAIGMCDRIQVEKVMGADVKKWDDFTRRLGRLRDSTLGNLIKILSGHIICENDLRYLRWLKAKRDFFIHRFFHGGEWPGELNSDDCDVMVRRLRYLEIVFNRASQRIWKVFARARLVLLSDLGEAGMLMMNPDMFEESDDGSRGDAS
jgi:hypothetical protein